MRILYRNGKLNKKTMNLTLHSETATQTNSNIALALLIGAYNPLRSFSADGEPIDLKKLRELQARFDEVIQETAEEMQIIPMALESF